MPARRSLPPDFANAYIYRGRQRELLRLRYEENMTVTEIAAAIGRDKSTVSRTLSRARRRLYKCLRYGL